MNDKKLKTLYDTLERCKILIEETGVMADILQIQNSGETDYMDRPIWVDQYGRIWVDVDMNNRLPKLHDVCKSGEPNCPIEHIWEENNNLFTGESERFVRSLLLDLPKAQKQLNKKLGGLK